MTAWTLFIWKLLVLGCK